MAEPTILASLLLAAAIFAAPLRAHEFNAVVIVPRDDPALRGHMTTAFLLASEEQDSHAGQESDGHLGGMDVYLTLIGPTGMGQLAALDVQFVAVPALSSDGRPIPADKNTVTVLPLSADAPEAAGYLGRAADPAFAPFAIRFAARTGQPPGPVATATYVAARRIGAAVRAAGGAGDPDRLKALIGR